MLAPGRAIMAGQPTPPGYYPVGPCHDLPFENRWIEIVPGGTMIDEIDAFDPGDDYISGVCP